MQYLHAIEPVAQEFQEKTHLETIVFAQLGTESKAVITRLSN